MLNVSLAEVEARLLEHLAADSAESAIAADYQVCVDFFLHVCNLTNRM
jgi:hypothetical protein